MLCFNIQFFRFVGYCASYIRKLPSAEAEARYRPRACLGENFISSIPSLESDIFVCSIHLFFFFSNILTLLSREQVAIMRPNSGLAHFTLQRGPPWTLILASSSHFPSLFLQYMLIVLSDEQVAILFPYQSKLIS